MTNKENTNKLINRCCTGTEVAIVYQVTPWIVVDSTRWPDRCIPKRAPDRSKQDKHRQTEAGKHTEFHNN